MGQDIRVEILCITGPCDGQRVSMPWPPLRVVRVMEPMGFLDPMMDLKPADVTCRVYEYEVHRLMYGNNEHWVAQPVGSRDDVLARLLDRYPGPEEY